MGNFKLRCTSGITLVFIPNYSDKSLVDNSMKKSLTKKNTVVKLVFLVHIKVCSSKDGVQDLFLREGKSDSEIAFDKHELTTQSHQ